MVPVTFGMFIAINVFECTHRLILTELSAHRITDFKSLYFWVYFINLVLRYETTYYSLYYRCRIGPFF